MRPLVALLLLTAVGLALVFCLRELPFGANHIANIEKAGRHYLTQGSHETGAANIVTSVVITYRGFDTLGEVAVLFIAAIGLGAVFFGRRKRVRESLCSASMVLRTGCRLLFPFILIFGAYIFIHGHLTPGGGFQGGVIIASGFLLSYIGCADVKTHRTWLTATESLAGSVFVIAGLMGLALGGSFLANFLPKGEFNTLFSAGVIPIIYVAIGFKVGSELAGLVADLLEKPE
ncbi:MAG: Na(+)/H(+) antiporter subunit B [Chitinispirillaceae bacterium]|nr:Na(+)/H(+) antiporter subunit B [Chitinispirillaceae bacterium]